MNSRLYVLCRKDMEYSSPAVQAGHAVAHYLLNRKEEGWSNETLIYLGVKNLHELQKWCRKLDEHNIKWYGFKEPDYNDELTAIAIPTDGRMKMFKHLKLL